MNKGLLIALGLAAVVVAVASGSKKKEEKSEADARGAAGQTGTSRDKRRTAVLERSIGEFGPTPYSKSLQNQVKAKTDQSSDLSVLKQVVPGLALLEKWLKRRSVPLVLDIYFKGPKSQFQREEFKDGLPYFETDKDSAMLGAGLAIRLAPSMITSHGGERRVDASIGKIYQFKDGTFHAWNPLLDMFEPLPLSKQPNGQYTGRSVESISEEFPMGLGYGSGSDRILYVLTARSGDALQVAPTGPQGASGLTRMKGFFPQTDGFPNTRFKEVSMKDAFGINKVAAGLGGSTADSLIDAYDRDDYGSIVTTASEELGVDEGDVVDAAADYLDVDTSDLKDFI